MKKLLLLSFMAIVAWTGFAQTQTPFATIQPSTVTLNSEYGRAVCINGDYAIVGALQDDHSGLTDAGAAFVYHYEGGAWVFQAKLISGDPDAVDHYGRSVFINDTHAIVGCSYSDDPATYNGSAYIYVNNNGTWTQQAKLLASDRRRTDRFGVGVGIYGDYAVVGCYGADYTVNGTTYSNGGAAYVYHFNGTSWGEEQRLIPNTPFTEEKFGWGVSIYDQTILVGTSEDRNNNTDGVAGSAYFFTLQNGTWVQSAKVSPSDIKDGDNFGCAVSLYKDYAIIGAFEDDDKGTDAGTSFIYQNVNGTWTMQQKLTASNGAAGDDFGYSVGIYENMAIVGAYHSNKGYSDTGSAYLFTRDGSTWTQTTELVADDPAYNDQLGWFVSITNGWAIAGDPRWDAVRTPASTDKATNEGCALIWSIPTVSTTNPPILSSLTPAKAATGIVIDQSLSVTFDKAIQFATSASQIVIKSADGNVFQSYSVGESTTDANLTISGSTLTIAHNNFENGTSYSVQFVNNPITSTTGDAFTGLILSTDWSFTTAYVTPNWATSSPALSGQSRSAITLTGQVNQTGIWYYVVSDNSAVPTSAQLAAGQDASGAAALLAGTGSATANTDFTASLDISGLESEKQYYVYAAVKNAGNLYTDIAQLSFTMVDIAAPVYENSTPSISNISGTSAVLNLQINEAGTAHYVILPSTAAAPSIANVLNGQDAAGTTVSLAGTVNLSASTAAQTTLSGLSYGTGYSVYVVTTDNNSNSTETSAATIISFTTSEASLAPPTATFTPADNATNVSLSQVITIAFDKTVYNTSTATAISNDDVAQLITVTEFEPVNIDVNQINPPLPPETKIAFSATYNSDNNTITITPSNGLKANYTYVITLASVQDELGNIASATSSTFTVGDAKAPVTSFYAPLSGAANVSISAPLVVTFNEAVRSTSGLTLTSADLQSIIDLRVDGASSEIEFSASVDAANKVITIVPSSALLAATSYALTINPVEDLLGNEQSMASGILFTTDTYNVWTGQGNTGVFTDDANWASPYVTNASAIIPLGTPEVVIASNTNINNLIIKPLGAVTILSGATLSISGNLIIESSANGNGSLINKGTLKAEASKTEVQQAISDASAWYYLSSPVDGYSFASSINAKLFNNASGQYASLTNTATAMNGYLIKSAGNITFTGALNNGDQAIAVNRTTNGQGWNLVGNPYTSAIDWDLIGSDSKDNIQNAFWIWLNSNQYGTYNGDAGIGTNLSADESQIPSNQAFWVNANGTGSLSLSSACQIHNSQSYLKRSSISAVPMIKLTGISGTVKDETVIAAIAEASATVENFDSEKMFGSNNEALELFTEASGKLLTINSLPSFSQETVIPLGYKVQKASTYQIELSKVVATSSSQTVAIEDKVLNTTTTLKLGDRYQFTSDVANTTARFALHITNSDAGNADLDKSVNVYTNKNVVFITLTGIDTATYKVMDMTGRVIASGTATSDVVSDVTLKNSGIYLVVVETNGDKTVQKVVVK
jgi:hypothetical protein